MTYRPLPDCLEIKTSKIDGLGLFAKCKIKKDTELGITHVFDKEFENSYIRTPMGGFFNHSDDPNCEAYISGRFIKLKAIKEIEAGEELTAYYWLYNLNK